MFVPASSSTDIRKNLENFDIAYKAIIQRTQKTVQGYMPLYCLQIGPNKKSNNLHLG